jgi:hypothetical protein
MIVRKKYLKIKHLPNKKNQLKYDFFAHPPNFRLYSERNIYGFCA